MMRARGIAWIGAAAALLSTVLFPGFLDAHVPEKRAVPETAGVLDFLDVGIPMFVAAILYRLGMRRLRQQRSGTASFEPLRPALFTAGWLTTAACLLSPLDTWAARFFSVHMIQHELLMLVAAPLLVLSRPLPVFLWAFSRGARVTIGRGAHSTSHSIVWRALTSPAGAWTLHALALWAWHAPALFNAALDNRGMHTLQHVSFFGTALLFWSALFNVPRQRSGVGVLYLFTTTVHTSVLGALITFASAPWYSGYAGNIGDHLTVLEDQQLGGLIMWVPCSLVYLAAALVLLGRWLGTIMPANATSPGSATDHTLRDARP